MKLINSVGPNPQVVRMFAAERGIALGSDIEVEDIDIMAGENRQGPYIAKNPGGQSPCLQTDAGDFIAEITAICEYLDEKFPGDSLIGSTPEERANTRMWVRRVDLYICENLANGFRYSEGLPLFKDRMRVIPEAADGLKALTQDKITWLDGLIEGRDFIAGDRLTLADVLLYCFLAFGTTVGQPLNEDNHNICAWFERMQARDSASA
ncbi:MAG: glutathione S-transferase family protein [Pseudomonadota bacterium]